MTYFLMGSTHFKLYFSGWIESDVHWGYDLGFDPQPHGEDGEEFEASHS